jgi:hypothetical protein
MDDTGACSLTIFIFMQARHLPKYLAQTFQLVQHFLRHIGYKMFVQTGTVISILPPRVYGVGFRPLLRRI